ncbi:hypothetical protein JXQ70_10105 [bacterium]|nr:hypothetical protein [bacterium]
MKKTLPLVLMFLFAVFAFIAFFVPESHLYQADNLMRNKFMIIISLFAIVLGLGSLIQHHMMKVQYKREYWQYSLLTLVVMTVTAIIGLFGGIDANGILPTTIRIGSLEFSFDIQTLYRHVMIPLGSSMFALLAFFMSSAAYRAFRARNLDACILLFAALIVMLGQIPVGTWLFPDLFDIRQWLLDVPNLAAKRGIRIGVALGVVGTAIKIILGIERSWLGGGSD